MTLSQEESRPFALFHTTSFSKTTRIWDAGFVTTERMVRLSLGQEGTKLLEGGLLVR
jgi:hypothetical protein